LNVLYYILLRAIALAHYSFKMAKVKKMMSANREKIKNSDDDLCEDLLNEYQGLLEAKKYISKYLGRVIG